MTWVVSDVPLVTQNCSTPIAVLSEAENLIWLTQVNVSVGYHMRPFALLRVARGMGGKVDELL